MKQTSILIPAMMLIGWTLLILLLIPYQRFKAYFAGRVGMLDFKCGESGHVLAVALAWGYVGLRVIHSLIHLSYNHVMHRFAIFAASNCVLAALWLKLLLALAD